MSGCVVPAPSADEAKLLILNRSLYERSRWVRSALWVVAIAAGAAFTAPTLAAVPDDNAAALVPASLQPPTALPATDGNPPNFSEIRNRIESTGSLTIAGQAMHATVLRQFYAAHNYEPVWPSHPAPANALLAAVLRAGEQGLDPDLFHAALLRNPSTLSPIDRDLLLSDAFLGYAEALARGALPIEQRMDDEDLKPDPVDVAATLDNAIASPDPVAAIEALAPSSADYVALRRALALYRAQTASGDTAASGRLREVEVNLERLRWLPRQLPADRLWVNLANAKLELYRNNQVAFATRVVIGQVDKQTPELQTTVTSLLFNPPWNVPRSIVEEEIAPKLSRDPGYLARHHMVWRRNGAIEQLPGNGTALGYLKFEMEDRFDVYLHDTPERSLFGRDNRQQSHGCVRVQNPRELASLLLGQPVDVINKGIALGYTNRKMLPTPIPVFLVYQTAFLNSDGSIAFRPDVYDRDPEIWQRLHPSAPAPVAEHGPLSERRG
jgi:L,D-transpeptidase YcbB